MVSIIMLVFFTVFCILFIGIVAIILFDLKKKLDTFERHFLAIQSENHYISEQLEELKKVDNDIVKRLDSVEKRNENVNQQLKLMHETLLSFFNKFSLIGDYMKYSYEYLVSMDDDCQSQYEELKQWVEDETHLIITEIRKLKEAEKGGRCKDD